jgi:lipopolysaccharide export system protein LptA
MTPSIKSLRRSVLAGAAVLLVALAVFLGIARLTGHHFHLDLPSRLGATISQTANGFTYSQSQKGHTLFTIHASKLVQYKADQAELHDVTITLYGRDGSGRSDKIYGSDFTYDRKQGIARAAGEVRIDFATPETAHNPGAGSATGPSRAQTSPAQTIHVTTSGLVFNQGTGDATTDQRVNFALNDAFGSATGAEYSAKDGVLVLDSNVALTTTPPPGGGSAAVIHAQHAQLLRESHQAYLLKPDTVSDGRHTTSDQAIVTFRPDGSAEQVNARGHVHLVSDDGAEMHASSALIKLDPGSRPMSAVLDGGVTYYAHDAEQGQGTMQGAAVSGTLNFVSQPTPGKQGGAQQQLHHAQFRDAVTFVLQRSGLPVDPNGSATRQMSATKVDIDFAPGPNGKAQARFALGEGGATVTLHDIPSKAPDRLSTISADQLLATLADGRVIRLLDGKGHTRVVDGAPGQAVSSTTGDTLHVTFLQGGGTEATQAGRPTLVAGASPAASHASAQVDTAMQAGNVTLLQQPAPGAKNSDGSSPSPFQATAQRAEYHAANQLLELTGDPHLRSDSLALTADRVDYHRDTGDASAIGNVKSTYLQQSGQKGPTLGGEGPVHVVADHAQLVGSTDVSTFYGTPAAPARMWQGADAVSAPVLELARDQQTLDAHGAHGDRANEGPVVHATLGSSSGQNSGPAPSAGSGPRAVQAPKTAVKAPAMAAPGTGPTRLACDSLHYSDEDHRADLRGSVTAEQPSGVLHADLAQVYLTPGAPGKPSQLDHMVATGHAVITQPGRRGTGERLVYTAADARYVLTGTPAQPPRIVDADKGTTTGAALLFKGADDSVEVSNHVDASPEGAGARVRTVTDTHAPK